MTTYLSAGFVGREKLGLLLNKRNLTNLGVEVGTHRGAYAHVFMKHWKGKKLYCVDPWKNPEGYELQSTCLSGGGIDREEDFKIAKNIASKHAPRIELIRKLSEEAAPDFENESLDFVYIDGDHSIEGITSDLKLWYPKIKPWGLVAGHDIVSARKGVLDGKPPIDNDYGRNIRKALWELTIPNHLDIYLIPEVAANWSFFIVKP